MSHFSNKIIAWYEVNKRDLPWRHTENPYHIWVSEIMLQQTQAQTVIPYYHRFIETLPTIEALANASEDQILKLWEGLGYYSRVRNMQKTAKVIMEKYQGIFPNRYDDVLALTGIGKYTAGAIMSIAFHQKYSAMDGNVMRVISRYFGVLEDITLESTKKTLESYNEALIDDDKPHLYTQAIIEMGATLCTKHKPKCELCPLKTECVANQKQLQSQIPLKAKQKAKKELHFYTFIVQNEAGQYIVQKVTDNLLKGLYLLPQTESDSLNYALETLEESGYEILHIEPLNPYKHVFTHLIWMMDVYYAKVSRYPESSTLVNSFNEVPMATAHKQITSKENL